MFQLPYRLETEGAGQLLVEMLFLQIPRLETVTAVKLTVLTGEVFVV